jgi:predicted enzyme related to lactoylglutathione lyase
MTLQYNDAFVALAAIDLEELVRFYQQLLERKPDPYIPHVYAEFQLTGLRLGIFCPQKKHHNEFFKDIKSAMSLCLEVADLEKAIAHLTEIGYPPSGEIAIASHGREIYAYDPAKNRLILHQSSVKK